MDLIRKILISLESGDQDSAYDGYDDGTIKYHKALVIEAGLAEGSVLRSGHETPAAVMLRQLTWSGHDFIDAISSDSNWVKVKDFLKESGKQITIDTVKAAITQLFSFGT